MLASNGAFGRLPMALTRSLNAAVLLVPSVIAATLMELPPMLVPVSTPLEE